MSHGGTSAKDVVKASFPLLIQRPDLAQHFNCGGGGKAGSVLLDPVEKRNFMDTHVQKAMESACRKVEPALTGPKFKTILSDYIKRSSQLKGGMAYDQKRIGKEGLQNTSASATSQKRDGSGSSDSERESENGEL